MNDKHTILGKSTAKAKRINLTTSKYQIVECELAWVNKTSGRILAITKGGITGCENVVADTPDDLIALAEKDWCACTGTPGEWDRLIIPQKELKKAITSILKHQES